VVLQIGGLELTEGPLLTVHAVLVKTLVAVSLLTVLGESLSMARLLEGLRGLGLPPSATLEAGLTWRYAGLVEREARALRRAVAARGWRPRWLLQAGLLGRLVASLFLRSVQRGERVHRAMLARGAERAAPAAARGALPPAQLAGAALLLVAALAMRGLP
jgi:cobalt/nickel transport system permease protein